MVIDERTDLRFIPTPVGNTIPLYRSASLESVYPHACGEHPAAGLSPPGSGGLSPRLWGTRRAGRHRCRSARFIPTPVGNTEYHHEHHARTTVYPHACGEHRLHRVNHQREDGLSPRLWGTRILTRGGRDLYRFIPTPVGNTIQSQKSKGPLTVYPHACGEHSEQYRQLVHPRGLSPRLWGTLHLERRGRQGVRFIPTPVGNTPRQRPASSRHPVYPHACGEHSPERRLICLLFGLSPRLWGTPLPGHVENPAERFIPTPVGNTLSTLLIGSPGTVYPHACGEHAFLPSIFFAMYGLSPRLWGTRHVPLRTVANVRFIPTPVGNTLNVSY